MPDPSRPRLIITLHACADRPRPPWLRVTVPYWLARILIAGGAREVRP